MIAMPAVMRRFAVLPAGGAHTPAAGLACNYLLRPLPALQIDQFSWDNPQFLAVFSAGNRRKRRRCLLCCTRRPCSVGSVGRRG